MRRAFLSKFVDKAAVAKALIDLADFVQLCLVDLLLELLLLLFSEIFTLLVDLVTRFLAFADQLARVSLIFAILNNLLSKAHHASHV